ncbi:hypothetical protein RLOC_00007577 [Lonchura striata]|uniref:Uncharacterized protein n=1 Tax=Lonchura striata TaxID=40157 RepID=A0A218U834_9PASE|nr:hypothetical protein RLOC_00007577 [Lonchura striata domestica]
MSLITFQQFVVCFSREAFSVRSSRDWEVLGSSCSVDGPCPWRRLRTSFGTSFSPSGGWHEPGSAGAEAALGSARALLGSALGTAGLALPSHCSDSFASDEPV